MKEERAPQEQGFTLIELLVVIAIIGILSSVVLASLNTARTKGEDGAVKSNMDGLRSQANIFADSHSYNYAAGSGTFVKTAGTTCLTVQQANTATNYALLGDTTFFTNTTAAKAHGGFCAYMNTATLWIVAIQLKGDLKTAWCIDSTGDAKLIGGASNYSQATLNSAVTALATAGSCG